MRDAEQDPIARFQGIFDRALELGVKNPNAMLLGTVGADGRPSARTVLLKSADEWGFVFYTNLESRKGEQVQGNPNVSLHFYWRELDRQVSIEGAAEPVTDAEADRYFATRPRASQLGAWASDQSRPLDNRAVLLARVAKYETKFLGRAVPRPPHWSGFRVVPARVEFWAQGAFRLHDRLVYERIEGGWRSRRLYP